MVMSFSHDAPLHIYQSTLQQGKHQHSPPTINNTLLCQSPVCGGYSPDADYANHIFKIVYTVNINPLGPLFAYLAGFFCHKL